MTNKTHAEFLEELKEFIQMNCYENDYGVHIIDEGLVVEKIDMFQAEQKGKDETQRTNKIGEQINVKN